MHMFYCIMKGVQTFAANFLSYNPTKYYYNWSTSDLVIVKIKRVNFFLKHSVLTWDVEQDDMLLITISCGYIEFMPLSQSFI